jgi:hypothetical protein
LQNTNNQLHNKLADYLRRKKSEEPPNQQVVDKTNQDSEQRYLKYLCMFIFFLFEWPCISLLINKISFDGK